MKTNKEIDVLLKEEQQASIQDGFNIDFIDAIQKNDLEKVKSLIKIGADINYRSGLALLYSVNHKNLNIIQYLLEQNINPILGIQAAICNNQYEILNLIFEKKHDFKLQTQDVILDKAICDGNLSMFKLLLSKGIDPYSNYLENSSYNLFSHAFVKAAGYGKNDIIEYLISSGYDINIHSPKMFEIAGSSGRLETIKLLFNKGIYDTSEYKSSLFNAAQNGHLDVVKLIIEKDYHSKNYDIALNGAISSFAYTPQESMMIINYIYVEKEYKNFDLIIKHKNAKSKLIDWAQKHKNTITLAEKLNSELVSNKTEIKKRKI